MLNPETEPALTFQDSLTKDSPVTPEEIGREMTTLKENKSPGGSGIESELFKWDGDSLNKHLLKVFNDFWNIASPLPRAWVSAIVVCIYTPEGTKSNLENFRPIFHLDTTGKLYASVLRIRLKVPLAEKLARNQYGFDAGRSTEQPMELPKSSEN